jgi:hypothetical protein
MSLNGFPHKSVKHKHKNNCHKKVLGDWKLQTVDNGKVVHVDPNTFESPYFYKDTKGVHMNVDSTWPTTANSKHPRTELREMILGKNADWSIFTGKHYMNFSCQIKTPKKMIFAQIKSSPGPSGAALKLWSENGKIWAQQGPHSGPTFVFMTNYNSQILKFKISAYEGNVYISDENKSFKFPSVLVSNYFKVGNYYHGSGIGKFILLDVSVKHIFIS